MEECLEGLKLFLALIPLQFGILTSAFYCNSEFSLAPFPAHLAPQIMSWLLPARPVEKFYQMPQMVGSDDNVTDARHHSGLAGQAYAKVSLTGVLTLTSPSAAQGGHLQAFADYDNTNQSPLLHTTSCTSITCSSGLQSECHLGQTPCLGARTPALLESWETDCINCRERLGAYQCEACSWSHFGIRSPNAPAPG